MTKIIVELCQNHGGSRETLVEMIRAAKENGADYAKLQTIYSSDLTHRERFDEGEMDEAGKQKTMKRPFDAELDRLSKLDLTPEDYAFFIEECKKAGITPMTTIFARHRIKEMAALDWPERIVKVASYDCASKPFLKELAENFDHLIVSTGATHDHEIEEAAALLKSTNKEFSMLHAVTSYPNTLPMANLARMDWLRQFANKVGWSDHTKVEEDGIKAAKVAIMLGADYVERHFTVKAAHETKDGPVSITPEQLKELSRFRTLTPEEQKAEVLRDIPEWETLVGTATREMTDVELLNRDYYRGRFASPKGEGSWQYNWDD
jgi:sialic acid synthase SpsE